MQSLADQGQKPEVMVVACCDSRVDPAVILQCNPGELFVARNVGNIVPPYETDKAYHGVSAALEFGICSLHVKHLIILGHSQCGGIHALLNKKDLPPNDFITRWVSMIPISERPGCDVDDYAQEALVHSYQNCMTFPWIWKKKVNGELMIHLWFFNIKSGEILNYSQYSKTYYPLVERDRAETA